MAMSSVESGESRPRARTEDVDAEYRGLLIWGGRGCGQRSHNGHVRDEALPPCHPWSFKATFEFSMGSASRSVRRMQQAADGEMMVSE